MKIIIAGGRDFTDTKYFMECIQKHEKDITTVVSGGAKGADKLGEILAKSNKFNLKVFKADWASYKYGAGTIRNKQMAEYADSLIAFWDGRSTGTHNMIITAKKLGLKVTVYNY